GSQEDAPQPRLVQRGQLSHDGSAHCHVLAPLRDRPPRRLVRSRDRAAHRRQDHPPQRPRGGAGGSGVSTAEGTEGSGPRHPTHAHTGKTINTQSREKLQGTDLDYYHAPAAVDAIQPGAWAKLPYTSRVLAEQLVRRCQPEKLTASLEQLIYRKRDL